MNTLYGPGLMAFFLALDAEIRKENLSDFPFRLFVVIQDIPSPHYGQNELNGQNF